MDTVDTGSRRGVSIRWTGFSTGTWDWKLGLDYSTGMWDWNVGLEHYSSASAISAIAYVLSLKL